MTTPPLLRESPAPPPLRPRTSWSLRPGLLLVVATCGVLLWVTQHVFTQTARGFNQDEEWRLDIQAAAGPVWDARAHDFGVVSLQVGLLLCAVLALVALARRRVDLFVRGAVLVAGANATTQILKHGVIERPPELAWGYSDINSLPSGHVTLVASVILAALIVLPSAARPLVALVGGSWAVAVAASTVVSGWHRPTDTVAALFVCVGWAALVASVRTTTAAAVPSGDG